MNCWQICSLLIPRQIVLADLKKKKKKYLNYNVYAFKIKKSIRRAKWRKIISKAKVKYIRSIKIQNSKGTIIEL